MSAYLFWIACRPKNIPSGATKTASSVKSAARATASLLLNASSIFKPSASNSPSAFGATVVITLLDYRWIGRVLCWAKVAEAKLIAMRLRFTSERIFIVSCGCFRRLSSNDLLRDFSESPVTV